MVLAHEIIGDPRFAGGDVVIRDGTRYTIEAVSPADGWIVALEWGGDAAELWDIERTMARAREGRIIPAVRQLALPGLGMR